MSSIASAMSGRSFGKEPAEDKAATGEANPLHDHLRKMRDSDGGKHMHIQSKDEGGYTSHQIGDGEPEGPHDHENMDALKTHMNQFLDEEAAEKGYESDDDDEGLM